jgi:hypothetical protein
MMTLCLAFDLWLASGRDENRAKNSTGLELIPVVKDGLQRSE